jgi:hypothetical protein
VLPERAADRHPVCLAPIRRTLGHELDEVIEAQFVQLLAVVHDLAEDIPTALWIASQLVLNNDEPLEDPRLLVYFRTQDVNVLDLITDV